MILPAVLTEVVVAWVFLVTVAIVYMFIGNVLGAPFVPLEQPDLEKILRGSKLIRGKNFIDMGSGDGRVVIMAAKKYGVTATGIEVHPLLVWYARWKAMRAKATGVNFKQGNFWKSDISDADYIFCYLFPGTVDRIARKADREVKKGCKIISVSFRLKAWDDKLVSTFKVSHHTVYIYQT